LRVNALANPEVGKYVNEYFCSSFQKVATFKIVGKAKQGGNVATYFCAPDGRVLHCIAGPVDAGTMLREAKWVVETAKKAIEEAKGDGGKFKAAMRKAHAAKLRAETGVVVEPTAYDYDPEAQSGALSYSDPTGQPLAPKLPPPPVDTIDVTIKAKAEFLRAAAPGDAAAGLPHLALVKDRRGGGRGWVLGNQGRTDMLLAAHAMVKIEKIYGAVFEGILGEKITTKPVEIVNPFPWHARKNLKGGEALPQLELKR
jgi:hypothetical protein